jgi:hypothetical protein
MKLFLFGLVAALLASGAVVSAQGRVHNVRAESSRVAGAIRVVFSTDDVRVLR